MGSDHGCDCKRTDDIQPGGGDRWGHITDAAGKGAGTTYQLEAEKEHDGVRDATAKGAGTTYQLEAEKDHDVVRDATARGAGTTYNLVVERDGVISQMRLQREQR